MDRVKSIEDIVKSICNKEGIAKRCPLRIADAIAAAGYSTEKQNIEELKNLRNELEFTKKDNKYWFGQAHCNFEDMRKGHKLQAIQELVEKLKEDYHIKLDGTSFVLVRFTELDEIIKELESKK